MASFLAYALLLWARPAVCADSQDRKKLLDAPVGFFHFSGYKTLDLQHLRGAPVRTSIAWGEFEPAPGRFSWDNPAAAETEELLSRGLSVLPAIRSKSSWAVEDPGGSKCASAPRDLDRGRPLAEGNSYSPSYFRFVRRIAERYKGKFPIIVIENEMNDEDDFWCSSVDDYLRLFLTAKKAYREADPDALISDGGLQGHALNKMVEEEYLRREDPAAAAAFHRKFSGEEADSKKLASRLRRTASKKNVRRAWELYRSPLFDWADIVNFHYYQKTEALPEVVAFLRRRTGDKRLWSNEVGIKWRFVAERRDLAAQELVKKCVQLSALGVRPVIWFSPPGAEGHNAGALTTRQGSLVPENADAFQALSRFLRPRELAVEPSRRPELEGFVFRQAQGRVEVYWPRDRGVSVPLDATPVCWSFDHRGRALKNGPGLRVTSPVFLVCGQPGD